MNSLSAAERAELERERLIRQKRRNGELDDDDDRGQASKKIKTNRNVQGAPEIADNEVIEISDDEEDVVVKRIASLNKAKDKAELFWDGESRSVRNQLVVNPAKTFSLDEIVGKVSQLPAWPRSLYSRDIGSTKHRRRTSNSSSLRPSAGRWTGSPSTYPTRGKCRP